LVQFDSRCLWFWIRVIRCGSILPFFPLFFLRLIGVLSNFFIGPLLLVQAPIEAGETDIVERIFITVWWPQLSYTLVSSINHSIKGNLALVKQDFDDSE